MKLKISFRLANLFALGLLGEFHDAIEHDNKNFN